MTREDIVQLLELTVDAKVRRQLMSVWFEHTDNLLREAEIDPKIVARIIKDQVEGTIDVR